MKITVHTICIVCVGWTPFISFVYSTIRDDLFIISRMVLGGSDVGLSVFTFGLNLIGQFGMQKSIERYKSMYLLP